MASMNSPGNDFSDVQDEDTRLWHQYMYSNIILALRSMPSSSPRVLRVPSTKVERMHLVDQTLELIRTLFRAQDEYFYSQAVTYVTNQQTAGIPLPQFLSQPRPPPLPTALPGSSTTTAGQTHPGSAAPTLPGHAHRSNYYDNGFDITSPGGALIPLPLPTAHSQRLKSPDQLFLSEDDDFFK